MIQLPEEGPYPPLVLEGYPKFLTEELNISQVPKLQKQKQILQKYKKEVVLAEEIRLHDAVKAFMEKVHKNRLDGKILIILLFNNNHKKVVYDLLDTKF